MNRLVIAGTIPSVNHMYRNVYVKGRAIKVYSAKSRKWFDEAVIQATEWRLQNKWQTSKDKVIVKIWFYYPNAIKRDTHNGLKILLDALEDARIYENDKTALPHVMDYVIDRRRPRVEIELERYE